MYHMDILVVIGRMQNLPFSAFAFKARRPLEAGEKGEGWTRTWTEDPGCAPVCLATDAYPEKHRSHVCVQLFGVTFVWYDKAPDKPSICRLTAYEGAYCTARTAHRIARAPRAQCRVSSFVFSTNSQVGRDAVA